MDKQLYPLSNPQKSIWLTEEYYKGTAINNISAYVYISDVVNFDVLKKAVYELVKSNDGMRLNFNPKDDSCFQYVQEYEHFNIDLIELQNEDDLKQKCLEIANTPFEENSKFLFKFIAFKFSNGSGGLITNIHHLISDSWSLGLISKEIIKNYSEILNGSYKFENMPSYLKYIAEEKEYKNSEKYIKDKEYWDKVFETVPEVASIKLEQKSTTSSKGKREEFKITDATLEKVKAFCDKNKISLYNFFMSIYSLYLSRVSRLDDFVVGTPILNRTNFEQKHTIGMFISVAPLRVTVNHELSFADFSKKIATDTMSLFRHQKYSYQTILENLRKKDASIPSLYNVILSYQVTKAVEEESGIKCTTDWVFNGNSTDELQIHLFDLNDEQALTVAYDYNLEQFNSQEISDIHNRILTIINQVVSNEQILLKDIEIVTPEEKNKILNEFNNTQSDYPRDKTIVDLFEEQVEKTPDNIAVVFEDQKLTYKELNEKANQVARYLKQLGIKEKDIISILLHKDLNLLISILAILKLGACYIPIDTNYPDNRIKYILDESKCKALLTTSNLKNKSNISICIDKFTNLEEFETTNLNELHNNKNLAYIIYTSGSTGKPKGVTISHKSLVNYIYWANKFYCNNKPQNFPLYSSFSFDLTVTSIYTPLICGGSIIIYNDTADILLTLTKIFSDGISDIVKLTPAHLSLVQDFEFTNTNVKKLIVGGDILTQEICKKITNKFKNIKIYNEYGPTEATVGCMIHEYDYNHPEYSSVPIGRPIDNAHIYILNKYLKPVPFCSEGEIYIGGDCLSCGYHDQSLNKNRFIASPFNSNEILYKTGDLAVLHRDNILEYIGRNDFQVKLNGFRIEIGEITKNILNFEGIKDCFVDLFDINSRKVLCVYYVSNKNIDINVLKNFLTNYMPDYMIPKVWTKVDSIPLTLNGKVNKRALPLPKFSSDDVLLPRNNTDTLTLKHVNELLNSDLNNINCNLFELGFDSLLAIKLAIKLSQEFNLNISVKDIFNNPIIKDLSNYISSYTKEKEKNIIKKANESEYYPISSAQKRIYFASSVDNNSTLYNTAGGIILDKALDAKKLEGCFKILINRHDALRTHFNIVDNEIVQIIDDKIDFNLSVEATNSNNLNEIYFNFVKPFDLSKAPLFRAKAIKLNDGKMFLLLDMHHIISDGTSLGILLQELCDLYNGNTLPENHVDYKDFAIWEKEQFKKEDFKNAKDFWVNQFKDDVPLLNMPTTYSRPFTQSFVGSNYYTKIHKEIFNKVNAVSQKLNITPYMLMLSAYYILLSKYTSQDDIVVGTPIVGRQLPELANMLGMFVNTLALRNTVNHSLTYANFANNIKTYCLSAFENQIYPFDELVKALNIKRDISRNPLFDVMFVYQNNGYPQINFKDNHSEYFIPNNNISKFDLSLEIIPINDEFSLRFEYCTKLFDEDFIKRLASHYINILNAILENENIKIADIDMLSKEERHQILYEFNNTKVDYPRDKTIVDLFEEQVEKTPNNIAVVFENQQLTYRELNEKANQLARFLIENGVASNDIVCLLLDKSLESIIAMISVLKVGATYLPIDVNYPTDRIDYIIRDSKSSILLTTKDNIHKANNTVQALCIDLNSSIYSHNNANNINYKSILPDTLAYIMYTSGSTGNPKGAMITHRNIVRLVKNNKFITFEKQERILQTGSIVFDACTFEIWGALLNGFELYIMKKEQLLDSSLLQDYLIKNKITIMWLTAPLFNQLCEDNPHMFRSLRILLTGGDVLSPKHINMVKVANPNLTVINGYGPTENTTFSTCFTIDKAYKNAIPIGAPISNSTTYVISPYGQLQPIGIPGELWVGGDGVGKGYFNNDELTSKKFISNPFAEGTLYKTGDLVKWLPDGTIDFIGRIDNQVKIRGFRVELGEISAKISAFPSIKECITVVNEIRGEKTICAYIVSDKEVDIQVLKQYLKKNLPVYMIPTYFMQLKKLPINTNGKVDRKLLPINFKSIHSKNKIKQPTNDNEKILLDIFKKLLCFDDIGIDDDFFELGGDSLLAIKLQVEAASNNLKINYADIFEYPTVEELAKHIGNSEKAYIENNIDYEKYDTILKNNVITENMKISDTPIGNVLLTGFTGFLGAHVLDSFIKKETGIIYCLIRGKNNMTPEERLKNVLHFYFDTKYDKYIGNRIKLVEGDITLQDFGLNVIDYNILGTNVNTIIHCAALVKHYGNYNDFEKINITGTRRIIDFSKAFHLKLLHISTISVSGNNLAEGSNIDNNFEEDKLFNETNFYIGQNLKNFYVRSKFEAEKLVLDAILNDNLQACILRMGNLTSRFSEGKFQQNHFENAFVNRIKSFIQIGYVPDYLLKTYCEFTPIDFCGDAIIDIANHITKGYTVFHLLNEKHVYLDRLFTMLHEIGINIKLVSEDDFKKNISSLLEDESKRNDLDGIINDLDKNNRFIYSSDVKIDSTFTKIFLEKLGFEWPYIDINYIKNYFNYLINIGYFDIKLD